MFAFFTWPEAHHKFAAEQWTAGKSATIVAQELNAKFRTSYSRSAIIGRISRAGLQRGAQPTLRVPRKHAPRVRLWDGRLLPLAPKIIETPQPKEFLGITFAKLGKRHCRFIRDDLYCGQRQIEGSSYCAWCHSICYEGRRRA